MRIVRWFTTGILVAGLMAVGGPAVPAAAANPAAAVHPMIHGINLENSTVLDLQRDFNRHQLSSTELTAFYIERIQALNPTLNAVIEVSPFALVDAFLSDLHRSRHGARSSLEGIPVLLKDNVDTAISDGMHSTAGSFALIGGQPSQDAFLVQRLHAAGAIILGKANLSEWANFRSLTSSSGWSARGGQANNPYVLDRNPCGSSSGSAVAVAANLATVAIGTETDGSIVCPSGVNDDVGIKPTLGLVSRDGVIPISAQQDTAGPITRNMTDAAVVLSVIQGVDPGDSATAAAAPFVNRNYAKDLKKNALKGKRIGIWRGGGDVASVNVVTDQTIATLRSLGATVIDNVDLPGINDAFNAEFPALLVEFKHDINAYLASLPGDHPADLAGLIAFDNANASVEMPFFQQEIFELAEATNGDETDPTYIAERQAATQGARDAIDQALAANHLDAIVAPTNGPAWVTNHQTGDDFTNFVSASGPGAIAGYPDLTVPAGYVDDNTLPIGMSFFGTAWSEPKLIAMGYAFEQATHVRVPPQFIPTLPGFDAIPAPNSAKPNVSGPVLAHACCL